MSLIELTGRIAQKQNITGTIGVNPITISGKINRTLPKVTVTFKDGDTRSGDTVAQQIQVSRGGTVTYSLPAKNGNQFLGWVLSKPYYNIIDPELFSSTVYQSISNVQEEITCWAVYQDKRIIYDSWETVSQRSLAGTAQNYYNVGDIKRVHLQGYIGRDYVNQDFYVVIIDFDHNSELEGNGITFLCFKSRYLYINNHFALRNFRSPIQHYDGEKDFNLNHWSTKYGVPCQGGWAGCDLRYDILGSTDVAPSGYGAMPDSSRVGYNATSTCATSPVANTFMSCLPSDLRAVMKPMTKYTINTSVNDGATATIDYLPLMSPYETRNTDKSHTVEKSVQEQYPFGVSYKNMYAYQLIDSTYDTQQGDTWTRSFKFSSNNIQGFVSNGRNNIINPQYAIGIAPIFLV